MTAALLILAGFGLVAGSFLGLAAYRLPRGLSVVRPGSRCPACATHLRAWQNVPVLSYAALGGRCGSCRVAIGWRYPAIELATAAAFVGAWLHAPSGVEFVREALFFGLLVALAAADLECRQLPDELTLGGWAAALVFAHWSGPGLAAAVGASALAAGLLALLGVGYQRWRGREGMGWGDVKMLGMLGAFLGVGAGAVALSLAAVGAAGVGLAQAAVVWARTGSRSRAAVFLARGSLPFGVFLAAAGAAALPWGRLLWRAWLGLP